MELIMEHVMELLYDLLYGLIYIAAAFILFFIAKLVYNLVNYKFDLNYELVKKDNFASAIAISGYYFGIILIIGSTIIGPSNGIWIDLMNIGIYGAFGIFAMIISVFINDKVILYKFDNVKEIIDDQNEGTAIVEAANYIAVGLILYGAIPGEGGILTALAFWGFGLVALILAALIYNLILPYNLHEHIEKDNVAVGIAFAGVIIAIGNIIRFAVSGDFISWTDNLIDFGFIVVLGLLLLPLIRLFTDKVLLPGESLTKELTGQEKPNLGAGLIEGLTYIFASFLLGWCLA